MSPYMALPWEISHIFTGSFWNETLQIVDCDPYFTYMCLVEAGSGVYIKRELLIKIFKFLHSPVQVDP